MIVSTIGLMGSGKTTRACQLVSEFRRRNPTIACIVGVEGSRVDGWLAPRTNVAPVSAVSFDEALGRAETAVGAENSVLVVLDEAQFLTKTQCDRLGSLLGSPGFAVATYGLSTDFLGVPFDATVWLVDKSSKLFEVAPDKPCACCGKRDPEFNVRLVDGEVSCEGDQLVVGDFDGAATVSYELRCRGCLPSRLWATVSCYPELPWRTRLGNSVI